MIAMCLIRKMGINGITLMFQYGSDPASSIKRPLGVYLIHSMSQCESGFTDGYRLVI